jgi:hypothetical protein
MRVTLKKACTFDPWRPPLYRPKDRNTKPLFPELFPLGGGLRPDNRWMKLGRLIPWNQMEEVYREYFSDRMGRPAKDSRLICGMLVVKHTKGFSDEEVVEECFSLFECKVEFF